MNNLTREELLFLADQLVCRKVRIEIRLDTLEKMQALECSTARANVIIAYKKELQKVDQLMAKIQQESKL
jgi:hypothetical protein